MRKKKKTSDKRRKSYCDDDGNDMDDGDTVDAVDVGVVSIWDSGR